MPSSSSPPRVWLLIGTRPGEIAQLRAVGSALGFAVVEKQVGVDALEAPWPDLVLAFGKDLALSAAIRRRSGGRTRIVQFGRSRGLPPREIDLLIALPQDCLPAAPNVLELRMSYNRQDPARMIGEARRLAPGLSRLPRPFSVLIVGGGSRHHRFDLGSAVELARQASAHASARGGSLLVTTSPRTGAGAVAALREAIEGPFDFYEFKAGDASNPLAGYLGLGDDLIVTDDSASMLAEAWGTGKPVRVFRVPARRRILNPLLRKLLPSALQAALVERGLASVKVDLKGWVDARIDDGTFAVLGEAPDPVPRAAIEDDDLARTLARIRALLPGR